jgi:cytochrome c553
MCAACHRLDGLDKGIPSIVGIDAKKLSDMLAEFKSGKRTSQIMSVVARSLSDEEIADLAQYLAARPKGAERP